MKPGSSWLCPTANHRERFLDMQERLRTARIVTLTTLSATAAVVGATGGWPMLVAALVAVIAVAIGGARLERRRRPELWVFVSTILVLQLVLAFGAVVSGGPRSLAPNLLAIPVLMVAARFSNRGLVVGAPVSALLVLATTLGVDPAYVVAHPESLMVPLALVMCAAVYVSPLVASDVRHRADSTLDQLTGLLNRRALEPRFAEIAEQAALTDQPVSVVLADLDHFKSINDEHGHGVGDAVLRDVAYAMRRSAAHVRAALPPRRRGVRAAAPGRGGGRRGADRREPARRDRGARDRRAAGDVLVRRGHRPRRAHRARAASWRTPTPRSTPPSAAGATASSATTTRRLALA